jgi:hypothetical protein
MISRTADMLRVDLLRPGDVILTHHNGKVATGNLALQREKGRKRKLWSHASIVISPCEWLESTQVGIAEKMIPIDKVETHKGSFRALYDWRREYRRISVWRHPALDARPSTARYYHVNLTLSCQGWNHLGREYARLNDLVNASPVLRRSSNLRKAASKLTGLLEKTGMIESKLNPGAFCSQLVASLFEDLKEKAGIDVTAFKAYRPPTTVSPSDFSDSRMSNLEEQLNLLTKEDPSLPHIPEWPLGAFSVILLQDHALPGWIKEQERIGRLLIKSQRGSIKMAQLSTQINETWRRRGLGLNLGLLPDPPNNRETDIAEEQAFINALFANFDELAKAKGWTKDQTWQELHDRYSRYLEFKGRNIRVSMTQHDNSEAK